jgi:hypothetical protein
MSFGESVFSVGFIKKTIKAYLHIRINRASPQQNGHQKVPEDSRGHHTEAGAEGLPGGAARQPSSCYIGSPSSPRLHLCHSLSRFHPRAHDGCSSLYKQPYSPLSQQIPETLIHIMRIRASNQEKISPPQDLVL